MNNNTIYTLFFIIIGCSSCNLFDTDIEEDRSSFFKIYPNYSSYNDINGDYLVNTDEGFLLGASFTPDNSRLSNQIRVNHNGALINRKNIDGSFTTYKKIIPSNLDDSIYFLVSPTDQNFSYLIKMALDDNQPGNKIQLGNDAIEPVDFWLLSNDNLIVLTENHENDSKLELTYLNSDLTVIWKREFALKDHGLHASNVIYDEETGSFIILGYEWDYKIFIAELNEDGNIVNTRFFEEFNFEPISYGLTNPLYEPVLLNMGTHYMVVETGRNYIKEDDSPYSSIYRISKDLNDVSRLGIDTKFTIVNTVQNIDNQILINGFIDSVFAIKKLDSDGNLVTWTNNEDFVTFNLDIKSLRTNNPQGNEIFNSNPAFSFSSGDTDFFKPGNIVKTTDGGYAMIGTYGIFNGDNFEPVVTLFKFRQDGSY